MCTVHHIKDDKSERVKDHTDLHQCMFTMYTFYNDISH